MNVIEKSIGDIKPYGKNPRKNDDAVKYVANSIRQFGFKVPIVVDKDGVIVAGHTRYKAAKELGLETVPVIVADDLTEEQVKAFRIADNKTGDQAQWDMDLLGEEIADLLGVEGLDMTDFGFGDFELTMLTEDLEPEPYDDEMLEQYSGNENNFLEKRRIIITYDEADEDKVKELLGLEEIKKVVYELKELR